MPVSDSTCGDYSVSDEEGSVGGLKVLSAVGNVVSMVQSNDVQLRQWQEGTAAPSGRV